MAKKNPKITRLSIVTALVTSLIVMILTSKAWDILFWLLLVVFVLIIRKRKLRSKQIFFACMLTYIGGSIMSLIKLSNIGEFTLRISFLLLLIGIVKAFRENSKHNAKDK